MPGTATEIGDTRQTDAQTKAAADDKAAKSNGSLDSHVDTENIARSKRGESE